MLTWRGAFVFTLTFSACAGSGFPDIIDAGLRVAKLGTTSVTYDIGLFAQGEEEAAAVGRFVHVWVDRDTWRPSPLPPAIRGALTPLVAAA